MTISDDAPFSLDELSATKWKIPINEILRRAVGDNGLKLSTWYEGPAVHKDFDLPQRQAYTQRYRGWATLDRKISGLLIVEESVNVRVLIKKGNCCFMPLEHNRDLGPNEHFPTTTHTVHRSKIVVLAREVERYERENLGKINLDSLSKILDPKNQGWHSEYLEIAVRAWLALYENLPGSKHDKSSAKPQSSHHTYIKSWLSKNYPNIKEPARINHICAIVNPEPKEHK